MLGSEVRETRRQLVLVGKCHGSEAPEGHTDRSCVARNVLRTMDASSGSSRCGRLAGDVLPRAEARGKARDDGERLYEGELFRLQSPWICARLHGPGLLVLLLGILTPLTRPIALGALTERVALLCRESEGHPLFHVGVLGQDVLGALVDGVGPR